MYNDRVIKSFGFPTDNGTRIRRYIRSTTRVLLLVNYNLVLTLLKKVLNKYSAVIQKTLDS